MGILELIVVLITISSLFFWSRAESRNDTRHAENQINAIRELIFEMHKEWMAETKSFHARFCEIEAREKKTT